MKNNIVAGNIHQAVKIEPGVTTSTLTFDHNDYYSAPGVVLFVWPGESGDLRFGSPSLRSMRTQ